MRKKIKIIMFHQTKSKKFRPRPRNVIKIPPLEVVHVFIGS